VENKEVYKTFHPEFVIDAQQNKREVLFPYEGWARIIEAGEYLDDIRAYDEAKSRPSDPVPL